MVTAPDDMLENEDGVAQCWNTKIQKKKKEKKC